MGIKKYIWLGLLTAFLLLLPAVMVKALGSEDCETGYVWDRMSGVGCKQENCNDIPDAHYSYTSQCICGTSGSMYESPDDPNKACYLSADNTSCPSCVYACVHANEDCPGEEQDNYVEDNERDDEEEEEELEEGGTNSNANQNSNNNSNTNSNQNANISQAGTNISLSTGGTIETDCTTYCTRYFMRGKKNATLLEATGTPPACQCQIDIRDDLDRLTQTIRTDGDDETHYQFDQNGGMIKKTHFNRKEESERVRVRIGYRYSEEEIDKLLDPAKIDEWFSNQIKNIDTRTSLIDPQFWWQHVVAIFDHGFNGNSADFVDTYQFGRCGDSMLWLERDLLSKLGIGSDPDKPGQKHEGFLSITGEKYSNILNHTSIMIRPQGVSNQAWDDLVKELKNLSGGKKGNPGIVADKLQNVAPEIMDAKVIDPYKKEVTTVREFIKGWSYLRIS